MSVNSSRADSLGIRAAPMPPASDGGIMFNLAKFVVVWCVIVLTFTLTSNEAVANPSCPKVGFTVVEPHATSETRAVRVGSKKTIFVHREPLTATSDITDIKLAHPHDGDDDDAVILLKFTRAADERLHDATSNHSGMRIAFMFNDEVLIDVVWEGPYGMDTGGNQVSMKHGRMEAQKLMKAIHGCTAPTVGDRAP